MSLHIFYGLSDHKNLAFTANRVNVVVVLKHADRNHCNQNAIGLSVIYSSTIMTRDAPWRQTVQQSGV